MTQYAKRDWWFFLDGFMEWMLDEFPEPMRNHFTYDLLYQSVNYLIITHTDKNEFIEAVNSIVPEISRKAIIEWINR